MNKFRMGEAKKRGLQYWEWATLLRTHGIKQFG